MWFSLDLIGLNQSGKYGTNSLPNHWLDLTGLNQSER